GAYPAVLASRDTVVEIRAPDYRTPDAPSEPKGVKLASVRLEQAETGGFIVPAYATLGAVEVGLVLLYLLVGRALDGVATLRKARTWGLLASLLGAIALVGLLAESHIAVSAA